MKKWFKYLGTGILITVIGGLILSAILSIIRSINFRSSLIELATFKIPLYLLVITVILLCCTLFMLYGKKHTNNDEKKEEENRENENLKINSSFAWSNFKRRPYKDMCVKWDYNTDGTIDFNSIEPICNECSCVLSNDGDMFGGLYCPKCEKTFTESNPLFWANERRDVYNIINCEIEDGSYKQYI